MADNLKEMLEIARREAPEVPDAAWARIEQALRINYGGERPYIAARRKRRHLDAIADADADLDSETLSAKLGVTVRRVQQLKKLR